MRRYLLRPLPVAVCLALLLAGCDAGEFMTQGEPEAAAPTIAQATAVPEQVTSAGVEVAPEEATVAGVQDPLQETEAELAVTIVPAEGVPTTEATTEDAPQGTESQGETAPGGSEGAAQANPLAMEQIIGDVNARVGPAVVAITPGQGLGSGFLIDLDGHIVTNNHVIEGAQDGQVLVSFSGLFETLGQVVGTDPDSDTAVVKVEQIPEGVQPVELGDSSQLRIGQSVIAIGNPFGQERTVTNGIVSALGRTIAEEESAYAIGGAIQTDAAINPGNSGGPLMDTEGRVIGMNTAILSQSGTSSGVGFSVPINLIKKVVPALIADGSYEHPWLGVQMGEVSTFDAQQQNLPSAGILMRPSAGDTPAAQAGLTEATIVTAINGQQMTSTEDVIAFLELNAAPGDTITLSVVDPGGAQRDLQVQVGSRPSVEDQETNQTVP